jgi:hypothetical protein
MSWQWARKSIWEYEPGQTCRESWRTERLSRDRDQVFVGEILVGDDVAVVSYRIGTDRFPCESEEGIEGGKIIDPTRDSAASNVTNV